ncbi:HTH domain-containing protein [Candidatus Woesearchaeota archaeon]|nr:HTH domain-containing protein [Candidatus Woesearchaeota archaeon]
MMDFACKKIEIKQVVKCGFGLSKADFRLMEFMLNNDEKYFTTHELSKKLGLNLSTIQRSVKKLHEKAVIERKQINLAGGGYLFTYKSKDKIEVRKLVISVVRNWTKKVEEEINRW